ncbi:hypothetical protein HDG37_005137 [Paraburkholderia sp. MM5384-R2]|nr:hypothetical protein [Paraburkholderia sp. MM5384-R2]
MERDLLEDMLRTARVEHDIAELRDPRTTQRLDDCAEQARLAAESIVQRFFCNTRLSRDAFKAGLAISSGKKMALRNIEQALQTNFGLSQRRTPA